MEIEKLGDFLKNCCRVCLSVETEMVESSNIVENFNKTIDQLLFECANMKIHSGNNFPHKLCEDCTTELVMVAKFREKCEMSAVALDQLKRQVNKTEVNVKLQIDNQDTDKDDDKSNETYLDSIEYAEDNVEYVIYDTSTDFIDEHDLTQDTKETKVADEMDCIEEETTYSNGSVCEIEVPINRHIINSKKSPSKTTHVKRKEDIKNTKKKSIIKHHCKLCGAGFAQLNNFTRHLQTHNEQDIETHLIVADVTEENVDTVSPAKSKKNVPKNHNCQYCDRAFPSLSLLTTHTRIHTGERPFHCSMCEKTFKTRGALDLHVRRHNGVKPYKCTVCNRGFVESSNLKVHMRTHTGEKPHQCVTCGRSFSRVFLLQLHQRTHTGEKPYQCDYHQCDKSFAQQGDLAAHKRIHSGERPHRCNVCNKGFIKSSGLTQHMRRHLRPNSKTNAVSTIEEVFIEDGDQMDLVIEKPIQVVTKSENVMICYKEYNENSETFDEYLE